MIQLKDLSKSFGKLIALNKINLSVEEAGCIALIGPNASGKTTLIKSILGLVIPDEGTISIYGKSIKGQWKYRESIGYMPQIGRYPDNMSIGQLFKMMMDIRKAHWDTCDIDLIRYFEIEKLFSRRLGNLSGGTRQKISACLAFLFNPSILILDEPTAGLDPVSAELLKEKILKEKGRDKLIFITSHILSDLDELADEVIYLQDGQISFRKKLDAIKLETGEAKLSRAIAKVMGYQDHG